MNGEVKRLRDAVPKGMLKPPLHKEDLLNKEITVITMQILPGEFGDFGRFGIRFQGERRTFITGSAMILERLEAAQEQFPVVCTVKKEGRAWLVE